MMCPHCKKRFTVGLAVHLVHDKGLAYCGQRLSYFDGEEETHARWLRTRDPNEATCGKCAKAWKQGAPWTKVRR